MHNTKTGDRDEFFILILDFRDHIKNTKEWDSRRDPEKLSYILSMGKLFRVFVLTVVAFGVHLHATETLHPILPPATSFAVEGAAELDEDVYSADMTVSAELAWLVLGRKASIYADGAFRFLSYSYEYSMDGYIHNYCNLHVNGFNETHVGAKFMLLEESNNTWAKGFGLNINWRFPPGEGSQLNRFHRLNVEPFYSYNFSKNLILGASIRYNKFLKEEEYYPGDEIGIKGSILWKFWWNEKSQTGWYLDEIVLYQARIQESENRHMIKPYQKMDDKYQGMKIRFDMARTFRLLSAPASIGIDYEIHKGTLFGFETGHRIGIYAKYL